ncbi:MAG: hypothetical protein WC730_01845 [Patescibacteria group bacterium]|jgi:ribulose-phosphate 3-epimerase
MTQLIPTVLAHSKEECFQKLCHEGLRALAPLWQIDVLDGSLFGASSWASPMEITAFPSLPDLEIHFMVKDPLAVLSQWFSLLPSISCITVHPEIDHRSQTIEAILASGKSVGLAIEATTDLSMIQDDLPLLSYLIMMGVPPGASGQPFLGEPVLEKIKEIHKLFPGLPVGIDGGITLAMKKTLISLGIERFYLGSSLWNSEDPGAAYQKFLET